MLQLTPRLLASNWYIALVSQEILTIKKLVMFQENAPIFSAFSHHYSCDTLIAAVFWGTFTQIFPIVRIY